MSTANDDDDDDEGDDGRRVDAWGCALALSVVVGVLVVRCLCATPHEVGEHSHAYQIYAGGKEGEPKRERERECKSSIYPITKRV